MGSKIAISLSIVYFLELLSKISINHNFKICPGIWLKCISNLFFGYPQSHEVDNWDGNHIWCSTELWGGERDGRGFPRIQSTTATGENNCKYIFGNVDDKSLFPALSSPPDSLTFAAVNFMRFCCSAKAEIATRWFFSVLAPQGTKTMHPIMLFYMQL